MNDDALTDLLTHLRENRPWSKRHPRASKTLRIAGWTAAVPLALMCAAVVLLVWVELWTIG